MTRYKTEKLNRNLKELEAIVNLKKESGKGNKAAEKLLEHIKGIRFVLEVLTDNNYGYNLPKNDVMVNTLRRIEIFLINQASKFGNPKNYLESVVVKRKM